MTRRVAALLLLGLLAPQVRAQQGDPELWRTYDEKGAGHSSATVHRNAAGRPLFVNALIRERSPYLLESANSPVFWLPWGGSEFAQARAQGKLVFVSVGYSSCHWCHVMARESFDDLGIAKALDRGFVAVKIDSEERPDLEERFLARLEALGISPGWPMNFVLTPDNQLIWGATFVGRDELLSTLERLESRWKTDRPRMNRLAAAREAQARPRETPIPAADSVAEDYARQGRRIAGEFDPVHKGFGTGPKFHAAAELGYLHDAFIRGADVAYGRMFVETVRAIASSGLNDAIDGGVFRYSVARDWLQPHFEKMLYDQAQVSRLMCQGYEITGDRALRRAATGILDFALSAFSTQPGLLASSFDAESEGVEGRYYLSAASDFERLAPEVRRMVSRHFRSVPQAAGWVLLVPSGASAADLPARELEALRAIRRTRVAPRRDEKAITAWNANMVAALAECGMRLGIPRYKAEAALRMRRLIATNAAGARISRYSIGGDSVGTATIDDLGWLMAALVSLHDADGGEEWLADAKSLLGRFLEIGDEDLLQGLKDFARDRSGPAASAVLVQALSQLAGRTEDKAFPAALNRMVPPLRAAGSGDGFASLTAALHDLESPMPRQLVHAAQGKVRLSVVPVPGESPPDRLLVIADIRNGWHINSHEPGQDYLRPTQIIVRGTTEFEVSYPAGKPLRFRPSGDVLSVLDGSVRFEVRIPAGISATDHSPVRLTATFQACTEQFCLRPESVELATMRTAATPPRANSP